jgi:DNA-binding NarL/FixJ family response regulator
VSQPVSTNRPLDRLHPSDTNESSRIRVLIVQHRRLLGEMLVLAVKQDARLEVVGLERRPQQAVARAAQTRTHVVLLDDWLKGNGLAQLIAALRSEVAAVNAVMLMTRRDDGLVSDCVAAGVVGLVTPDDSIHELNGTIRRAHSGEWCFTPETLANLQRQPPETTPRRALTRRELHVLQTLATGCSAEHAADQLSMRVHTLRTHVRNAMAKLEAHTKVEAIILALREGLIALPPASPAGAPRGRGVVPLDSAVTGGQTLWGNPRKGRSGQQPTTRGASVTRRAVPLGPRPSYT